MPSLATKEIGRAGRDGLPAETILFYSYADVQTHMRFADEIDGLQRVLGGLLDGLSRELTGGQFSAERKRAMNRELVAVRKLGSDLVLRIEALERELVSPLERAARQRAFGAGGGSDELL